MMHASGDAKFKIFCTALGRQQHQRLTLCKNQVQKCPAIPAGEGLSLLEKGLGCTLPESQQEGGLSVGAAGPQGASQWRDYPRRSVRARSFAP
jgi:hypothetical protein